MRCLDKKLVEFLKQNHDMDMHVEILKNQTQNAMIYASMHDTLL